MNQTITKENIETSISHIKEGKNLDSTKINILDNLLAFSKGREEYIKICLKEDFRSSIGKYVVSEETFNKNVDDLYNSFSKDNVTYKMLLTEIDTLKSIMEKRDKKSKNIYKQIDDYCKERQNEISKKEENAKLLKDSLNKMIDLKILSIKETEIDYRDVVQVAIQMTNRTNKKIEALSFNLELTDKLGTNLGTLRCRSNDGFLKSDVGYWTYDKWENDVIYKSLRNVNVAHVTAKKEITKLNISGELISEDDYTLNLNYKSPKKLIGYCPYLDANDEMNKKVDEINNEVSKEIKGRLKILTKYNESNSKMLDFSQSAID